MVHTQATAAMPRRYLVGYDVLVPGINQADLRIGDSRNTLSQKWNIGKSRHLCNISLKSAYSETPPWGLAGKPRFCNIHRGDESIKPTLDEMEE